MNPVDEPIKRGRQLLKSNWELLDGAESDQSMGISAPDMQMPIPSDSAILDLPKIDEIPVADKSLFRAIAERQSQRRYIDSPLSPADLSFLLWATQGVHRISPHYSKRTVPSAGARHPFETYVYCDRVTDIEKGLYRYLPFQHKLCSVSKSPDLPDRIAEGLHGQRWNSAAVFLWTAIPYRMEWRYSVVSHKLIALDAGHLCQNLYIACSGVGCGTCALGAYDQDILDEVLGVDGEEEFVIYAAVVGKV